jgi:nucleotide-binding universal stress UspA family protein
MSGYETILAATDFSALANRAVASARHVANGLGAERIHFLHVIRDPGGPFPPFISDPSTEIHHALKDKAQRELEAVPSFASKARVTRAARFGIPAREIALEAGEVGADLIVAGSHGYSGVKRWVLGSVTHDLVRVAPAPLLVVNEGHDPKKDFKRIAVAVDLSPVSRLVLEHGVAFARAFRGQVSAISVLENQGTLLPADLAMRWERYAEAEHQRSFEDLVARVPHADVEVAMNAVSAVAPFEAIMTLIERDHADLVVVGTSGRNAWQRMLIGSTASRMLTAASCPVLVVPHDGI